MNYAINRVDLIRYATKGNGVIIPALVPRQGFGYDPALTPYPFNPGTARRLLGEAGYPNGLSTTLIAAKHLEVQATVVSKMLEQVGLTVERQILDPVAYARKTSLSKLEPPLARQTWDIASTSFSDVMNLPVYFFYHIFALEGRSDWVIEQPELRKLQEQVLGTIEPEHQRRLIRQMERHTRGHAYFLFLYNPIQPYAVNKAVEFVPYTNGMLHLAETSVTDRHWSVRNQKAAAHE